MDRTMNASAQTAAAWLLGERQLQTQTIGVIGAGTMGAGIAQIAASAGHPVRLMDNRPGAAAQAHDRIATALESLVTKRRMTASEREALLARIVPIDGIAQLKDAALVIEA